MKGSSADIIFIVAGMFLLSIVFIVGYILLSNLSGTAIDVIVPGATTGVITQARNGYVFLDNAFIFILVMLSLGAVVSASMINTRPIFFIADFLLIALMILVGTIISNAYYTIASDANMVAYASFFPNILFIMEHLPHYIAIMGIFIAIAYYAKGKQELSGGYLGGQ